jgi:hypothetical protein
MALDEANTFRRNHFLKRSHIMLQKLDERQELIVLDAEDTNAVVGGMINQYEEGRPKPPNKPPTHFWYGGTIADAGL